MFRDILKAGVTLVPNFQQRVLLGTATFVGTLLLVGWVVINEPARMQVFTEQYHGRSIEAGAILFLNNCSSCHGVDGKGQTAVAPALNNPMLFLKDNPAIVASKKVDDLKSAQATIQGAMDINDQNIKDLAQAQADLKAATAGSDKAKELQTKVTSLTAQIQNFDKAAEQKKFDDLTAQITQAQKDLDALTVQGWDVNRDVRLKEVKWGGSLDNYLESTITSGRPVSAAYWPNPMPAWGQLSGGPLRPDEVRDLVAYIDNFNDTAIKLTPKDVNQQFKLPGEGGPAAGAVKLNVSGTAVKVTADVTKLDLKPGDAKRGEQIYTSAGCAGCHSAGVTAPKTEGTFTRIVNDRLKDPKNAGKTPEQYIAESIIHPSTYVVPGFPDNLMPKDWGAKMDIKDIQDLIAYIETQK
jgi:mono/diheme cytochrome c family protein